MKSTKLSDAEGILRKIGADITDETKQFYLEGSDHENELFLKKLGQKGKSTSLRISNIIDKGFNTFVICTYRDRKKYNNALTFWNSKGYIENETFFQAEVFSAIYNFYKYDKMVLDRVEIFLTPFCTLNCEKCIAYIPYFKEKKHVGLQMLLNDADLLFGKVDFVDKLKVLGGEGFLYPYLKEYLDYLYENYGDKIGSVRIGTNGTIFPKEDILAVCRKYGVIVDVSDYMNAVPDKCHLQEVVDLLEDNGVRYDIKRTGEQWLDMGFPNNIPEPLEKPELEEHFHKCAMFCRQFYDGKFFFCCSNFAAVRTGMFPENENDYLDFRKEQNKEKILAFELGYTVLGHLTFCKVCRGCSEEANPLAVEVAKQIGEGK